MYKRQPPARAEEEFRVVKLELSLPDTVLEGQEVRARIEVTLAEGTSGYVGGKVYIDGDHWHYFHKYISGHGTVETEPLPTDGGHSLKVTVTEPNFKEAEASYHVKAAGRVAGLDSLVVVPGLAYLKDINGELSPSDGHRILNGTGKLRIKPLDDNVVDVTISNLKLSWNSSHPESSKAVSGTLTAEADSLFSLYKDILRVKKVTYSAPDSELSVDAEVFLPIRDDPLLTLKGLVVTAEGIRGAKIDTTQGFTFAGLWFGVHDTLGHSAVEVKYESKPKKKFSLGLYGSIKLRGSTLTELDLKVEYNIEDDELDISGNFPLVDPFRFIPGNDYVLLDTITIAKLSDGWGVLLKGRVNLPAPLDTLGARTFRLEVDKDGNVTGGMDILGPEEPGLEDDLTKLSLWIATLDLTYLGLKLRLRNGNLVKDSCEVQMVVDLYFPGRNDTVKVSLGEVKGSKVTPGISVDFEGNVTWDDITFLQGKNINLKDILYIHITSAAIQPDPFAFKFSGSFKVDLSAVEGGVEFRNLKLDEHGFVNVDVAVTGGSLDIYDVVNVTVGSIAFCDTATTLPVKRNVSGDQEMREGKGKVDSSGIAVQRYFEMTGAKVAIGSGSSTVGSGGFERLVVFTDQGGSTGLFINGVHVKIQGAADIKADFEYCSNLVRFAGSVKLPNGAGGIAVGKAGLKKTDPNDPNEKGEPTFGLFLAATGLSIPIFVAVYLDDVGGGFFYNPDDADIEAVHDRCGLDSIFQKKQKEMQEQAESGAGAGSFAIFLYAGVYVQERSLVKGKALMAFTGNYFSLDAEVEALDRKCEGDFSLTISWNPAYAQGGFTIHVDFYSIVVGDGMGGFYVFEDTWGVMLSGDFEIVPQVSLASASADFFVGSPGFLLDVKFSSGINIAYVLSGGMEFEFMIWWQVNVSWGAYASLYFHGEILAGLLGAGFGLEGAFIGEPELVIYAVGKLKVEVCWITVFEGSIWISIGENGLDGGTGRNSKYDKLIADARNISKQMEEDMEDLKDQIDYALAHIYDMSQEQIENAGQQLITLLTGHWLTQMLVGAVYVQDYQTGPPNPTLELIFDAIFAGTDQIKAGKDSLRREESSIRDSIQAISDRMNRVKDKLGNYRNLLEGELPSIRELGVRNPVGAPTYATRTIGDSVITFQTGFAFDESAASSNTENTRGTMQDIVEYQNRLKELVDQFTANVDTIDALLYSGDEPVFSLTDGYTNVFEALNEYYIHLFGYIDEADSLAKAKLEELDNIAWPSAPATQVHIPRLKLALEGQAKRLSLNELKDLVERREGLIHALDSTYTPIGEPAQVDIDSLGLLGAWRKLCVAKGMEVWYYIPKAGFQHVMDTGPSLRQSAKEAFGPSRDEVAGAWSGYTEVLDGIYARQSRLYEILYDLYDQLAVSATTPPVTGGMGIAPLQRPEPGRKARVGAGRLALPAVRTDALRLRDALPRLSPLPFHRITGEQLRSHFARCRDLVGSYLEVPTINSFSGEATVKSRAGYAKVELDFSASHPHGVTEYAYRISHVGWNAGRYRSVGKRTWTHLTLMGGVDPSTLYWLSVRARGRGGYTIARTMGRVSVNFGQEAAPEYTTPMELPEDNTPPTTPFVSDGGEFSTSREMLYGTWLSSDPESGVQEYQYAVGTMEAPRTAAEGAQVSWVQTQVFQMAGVNYLPPASEIGGVTPSEELFVPVKDFTSAGGMRELNIRGLSLEDGHTYYIAVKAKNGAGLWSDVGYSDGVIVDGSPPTGPEIESFRRQGTGEAYRTLQASWSPSSDPHSGFSHYIYFVGTTPRGSDVVDSTRTYTTSFSRYVPGLTSGTYYLTVMAFNGAGLFSSDVDTLDLVLDTKPPPTPTISEVTVEEEPGPRGGRMGWRITARFTVPEDPESGVVEVGCTLEGAELFLGGAVVHVGGTTYEMTGVTREFPDGFTLTVTATNGAGLRSQAVYRRPSLQLRRGR